MSMKTIKNTAAAAFALAVFSLSASAEGLIKRTILTQADLAGVDGMEVITGHYVVQPGGHFPLHTHHGDEHVIVSRGGTVMTADGQEIMLETGVGLSFARGVVHGGLTITGDTPLEIYTVHIVDKGKPLMVLVE